MTDFESKSNSVVTFIVRSVDIPCIGGNENILNARKNQV
jgi:hypothetical protein